MADWIAQVSELAERATELRKRIDELGDDEFAVRDKLARVAGWAALDGVPRDDLIRAADYRQVSAAASDALRRPKHGAPIRVDIQDWGHKDSVDMVVPDDQVASALARLRAAGLEVVQYDLGRPEALTVRRKL